MRYLQPVCKIGPICTQTPGGSCEAAGDIQSSLARLARLRRPLSAVEDERALGRVNKAPSGAGRNVSEMRSIDAVKARGLGGAKRPRIKYSTRKADAKAPAFLRRERDSNSRYPFGVHTLSRRASSATRASLQFGCKYITFS